MCAAKQVAPSFFDSPASQFASFFPASEATVNESSRPHVTIVFCALSESAGVSASSGHKSAMNDFRSCVRTSLLLLGGVECREKEGKCLRPWSPDCLMLVKQITGHERTFFVLLDAMVCMQAILQSQGYVIAFPFHKFPATVDTMSYVHVYT